MQKFTYGTRLAIIRAMGVGLEDESWTATVSRILSVTTLSSNGAQFRDKTDSILSFGDDTR